jgi:hypothetical protein
MGRSRQNPKPKQASYAEFQLFKKKLDESFAQGGPNAVEIVINGDSMRPWILPGECLLVRRVDPAQLKIFDPIVFWNGQQAVCHLFLKKNQFRTGAGEDSVLTRGLNSKIDDLVVPVSKILGLAVKAKPWWLGPLLLWRKWKS